ncbi:MAG TPA: hypothetical protein VGB12_09080, partial [bacterium]
MHAVLLTRRPTIHHVPVPDSVFHARPIAAMPPVNDDPAAHNPVLGVSGPVAHNGMVADALLDMRAAAAVVVPASRFARHDAASDRQGVHQDYQQKLLRPPQGRAGNGGHGVTSGSPSSVAVRVV